MIIFSSFLLSFLGCAKPFLKREDLIGQWKSDLNQSLVLNEDSTFVSKDFMISRYTSENFLSEFSEMTINGPIINGKGIWRIYKNKLCLTYSSFIKNGESINKGYGFTLSIIGSGFLENSLPWKITSGGVDDDKYSVFKKVE